MGIRNQNHIQPGKMYQGVKLKTQMKLWVLWCGDRIQGEEREGCHSFWQLSCGGEWEDPGIVMAVEGLQAKGEEPVERPAVIWEEEKHNGSTF